MPFLATHEEGSCCGASSRIGILIDGHLQHCPRGITDRRSQVFTTITLALTQHWNS